MQQHMKVSRTYHFVTLTYGDPPPLTPKGFMTLDKLHLQKFFKRLRKYETLKKGQKSEIKYYAVGEYGSKNQRPHYHAIIFNSQSDDIVNAWQGSYPDSDGVLCEHGKAEAQILDGTDAIAYCAKYINKQKTIGKYEWDDRLEEFQTFSQGLGANYITKETVAYHKNTLSNRVMVNGYGKALPRWFRDQIFSPSEKLLLMLRSVHKAGTDYHHQVEAWKKSNSSLSFEKWRYEKKVNAINAFRDKSSKRKDI